MNDAERKIYMFLCIAGREAEAIKYRRSRRYQLRATRQRLH